MSNRDDFETILPALLAIPAEDVKRPREPPAGYAEEADSLYKWARPDRAALEAANLSWDTVESLPSRAAGLREAQSDWIAWKQGQGEIAGNVKAALRAAGKQRALMIRHMRYAYRHDPDLLARVSEIAAGSDQPDLVQDLVHIDTLGRDHLEPLLAIGVGAADLDRTRAAARTLRTFLAACKTDAAAAPWRDRRDRAYLHLKRAVDAIRTCGQYVFRDNPERRKGYTSAYWRRFNSRRGTRDRHPR